MLAQLGDVWVITRAIHRPYIEAALVDFPLRARLNFVYVEARGGHVIQRGERLLRLNYMLWQVAALKAARKLRREIPFDVAWHLTWANAWLGTLAPFAGAKTKFVYGPIGGGVRTPWRLVRALGLKGTLLDAIRRLAQAWGRYLNPLARVAWRRADLILVQNPETRDWLPGRYRSKTEIFPHVVLDEVPDSLSPPIEASVALFAGRLLPWKGCSLALESLRHLEGWRLVVCGTGPDEARLKRTVRRLGLEDRVRFRGWVSREELLDLMRDEVRVLLFPSLHDEAGWVVAEALSLGVPVVSLAVGGPPVLGARGVAISGFRKTSRELAEAVLSTQMASATPPFDIDSQTRRLIDLSARYAIKGRSSDRRHHS